MLGVHLQCRTCGNRAYVDYEGAPDWLKDHDPAADEPPVTFDQLWQVFGPKDKDSSSGS
jgi:hypothetical protein